MFKEFKEFAMRGNVLDMAVGIIIGGAFGKIITSFVGDILMPPVGMLIGKVDLSNMFLNLGDGTFTKLAEAKAAGVPTINYGLFLNTMIDFVIVAFVVFLLIRQVNRLKREPAPAPAAPVTKDCPHCCTAIAIKATRCPACTAELKPA